MIERFKESYYENLCRPFNSLVSLLKKRKFLHFDQTTSYVRFEAYKIVINSTKINIRLSSRKDLI